MQAYAYEPHFFYNISLILTLTLPNMRQSIVNLQLIWRLSSCIMVISIIFDVTLRLL